MFGAHRLTAQSPAETRDFHDRVAAAIQQMSNRPLTPGDTFLTWNPKPGGLIHTLSVGERMVSATLLRGDGMIGTVNVRRTGVQPTEFDVLWTSRDTVTGKAKTDLEAHGTVDGDTLRVTGSKPSATRIPVRIWGVADFGMEEALIPIFRSLSASAGVQKVAVFRPWHSRWDTVSVAVRDTAGVRIVDHQGVVAFGEAQLSHEFMILNERGELLEIIRFDQSGERHPLEGTSRYDEYRTALPLLATIIKRYAPSPPTSP